MLIEVVLVLALVVALVAFVRIKRKPAPLEPIAGEPLRETLLTIDAHAQHRKARVWQAQHVRVDALDTRRRPGSGP